MDHVQQQTDLDLVRATYMMFEHKLPFCCGIFIGSLVRRRTHPAR